ncbi:hypothetical protein AJ80_03458 [Polytolypa hystricis UAMH7299]|uniref:Uncharacterized protein n=1 Tax=Polytolypa hystricis (strain UAMH7299) TaxID=1447883 RepID=A0A2B7YIF1_POLH7|nr:hypothetical protein AJ80_03458 [Polytolypa hystricis UAMH7299]
MGSAVQRRFTMLTALLVDLNNNAPSTVRASCNIIHCAFARLGTTVLHLMIGRSYGLYFTILGVACATLAPFLVLQSHYSVKWRRSTNTRVLNARYSSPSNDYDSNGASFSTVHCAVISKVFHEYEVKPLGSKARSSLVIARVIYNSRFSIDDEEEVSILMKDYLVQLATFKVQINAQKCLKGPRYSTTCRKGLLHSDRIGL